MRRSLLTLAFLPAALGAQSLAHAKHDFDLRNWDAAKAEFTTLSKASPTDVAPVLYLGRIALAQNEVEQGIKHFEHCVEVDDSNASCHAWLGNALGQAAQHASKLKLPFLAKRTKKEFDRAVELDPNNLDGRTGQFQYYMLAPGFLGGSTEKAREQAAEIDKRNKLRGALAYAMLADHEKNPKEAEAAYQRAITAAPDSTAGYYGLVNVYARDKRWSDAFAVLDRFVENNPNDPAVLISIARVAYLSGEQLQRGEEAAKKWIANPPKDISVNSKANAHLRLGNIYEKTGRKELARSEYELATQLNPKNEETKKALANLK